MKLHKYQLKAVEFIKKKKRVALLLSMGLGKTVSTLTAISDLNVRVLIVAPLRVANTVWKQEASKWEHLNHLDIGIATGTAAQRREAFSHDIVVINRENIAWMMANIDPKFDMLVVDESSSFKSAKSARFKALKKLEVEYCVLLTGTVSPSGLMDLWSQYFLLDRGHRLGRTITAFRNRFFRQGGFGGYQYEIRKGSADIIHNLVKDISLSMSAEDYLDMPDKINLTQAVELPEDVQEKYTTIQNEFVLAINDEEISILSAASLSNKLLQMGNGFIYTEEGESIHLHDAKVDALSEIINDNTGDNILVFYNFKADLTLLQSKFKQGVVLDKKNKAIDEWNKGNIPLLFAQPASASMGINLQKGGNIIVWYGLTWNLEHYQQGNARLHRQGQDSSVTVMHLVVKGGIDEKIMLALNGKAKTQQDLLDYLKS